MKTQGEDRTLTYKKPGGRATVLSCLHLMCGVTLETSTVWLGFTPPKREDSDGILVIRLTGRDHITWAQPLTNLELELTKTGPETWVPASPFTTMVFFQLDFSACFHVVYNTLQNEQAMFVGILRSQVFAALLGTCWTSPMTQLSLRKTLGIPDEGPRLFFTWFPSLCPPCRPLASLAFLCSAGPRAPTAGPLLPVSITHAHSRRRLSPGPSLLSGSWKDWAPPPPTLSPWPQQLQTLAGIV